MADKLKMSTTASGAKQYSTKKGEEILTKQADTLFRRFLKKPTVKAAEDLNRLDATRAAAAAQRWRSEQPSPSRATERIAQSYDRIERLELSFAEKRKLQRMLNKAKAK